MTELEIKEINDFVGQNSIRNGFLPIMHHVATLKPKKYSVEEYQNKNGETTCVQVIIEVAHNEYPIIGEVRYADDKTGLWYHVHWSDENYCCLYSTLQMKNFLTMLVKQIVVDGGTRTLRKMETLIPYENV